MLLISVLALIGLLALCYLAVEALWSPLEFISSYLMPYFLPTEVQPLLKRFGPWAAVTGSTDGIGKQYALELARRGFHVVLISRNPDKLNAVADEIRQKYNVKTKTIVADFSKGAEIYPQIKEGLKEVDLGLLVNNVGINHEYPMPLCDISVKAIWDLINVNVAAVTLLTKMVLPRMVERGSGGVVNVSSGSELQPVPLFSIYSATKSYIKSFTLAIREEYAPKGIFIQHLSPFFVCTKINSFSKRLMKDNLMVPDAASYARQAVATLGRVRSTHGYWAHGIQGFFVKLAPMPLRIILAGRMFGDFRDEYLTNANIKAS